MHTITFSGHSDDVMMWEMYTDLGKTEISENDYVGSSDEYYSDIVVYDFVNKSGLVVFSSYEGAWGFGVRQIEEEFDLPSWDISYKLAENGYSIALTINTVNNKNIVLISRDKFDKWLLDN